jgi:aromatic-amino-acid transaminase
MMLDAAVDAERPPAPAARLLGQLSPQPADPLLALIGAYRADARSDKIDLGVGVYRDENGSTPVFRAVKAAEERLVAQQPTKGYLGPEGDIAFFERLQPILFGSFATGERLSGLQTPGGTGALRLAAELIAVARPTARVFVGQPTWPNHLPILNAARLSVATHPYFNVATQAIEFDAMMQALSTADAGDVVLLHGCCHNPVGADLDLGQWAAVARLLAERGALPLIDLAYQGLGLGLDEDAAGMRLVLEAVDEALVAYSCDKNFGLYRERTGALFALSGNAADARTTQSNLLALARANWSMPPDHGAAIVRTILEDEALTADWRAELGTMRERIIAIRVLLAQADPALVPLIGQHGMFATLPLSPEQVRTLRDRHGIYMTGSGRINIAGLTPATVPALVAALATVR